jgi:pimeloyl-ACP methyl ester carboxylesterase
MAKSQSPVRRKHAAVPLPIWLEGLVAVEVLCLRVSPIYWGFGVPRGDGSAVVVVPGFMMMDLYLAELRGWLGRIGYRTYASGIGWNAECPNLLIRRHLTATVEKARKATKRKVHLIGHSLGGVMARAIAAQMPDHIASVITLASPFQGISAHSSILRLAEWVRSGIHKRNGGEVLPECYTAACTCNFLEAIAGDFPRGVRQTAIYTKSDGIVDWKVCGTGDPAIDCEVSATHLGLVFNPNVYDLIGRRLAASQQPSIRSRRCA